MFEKELSERIKNTRENYQKMQNKQVTKDALITSIIVISGVAGIITLLTGNFGVGLGLLSVTAGTLSNRYRVVNNYFSSAARYQQELGHLRRIKEEEESKEIIDKKSCKLFALYGGLRLLKDKCEEAQKAIIVTNLITAIGAFGIILSNNPAGIWMPLIGIGGSILANIEAVRLFKSKEKMQNRCDNLQNDLDLEEIKQEDKNEKEKEKNQEDNKTKSNSKRLDEILVSSYNNYDELDNTPSQLEKPKQYRK